MNSQELVCVVLRVVDRVRLGIEIELYGARAAGSLVAGMNGVARANERICMRARRTFCWVGVATRQTFQHTSLLPTSPPPTLSPHYTPRRSHCTLALTFCWPYLLFISHSPHLAIHTPLPSTNHLSSAYTPSTARIPHFPFYPRNPSSTPHSTFLPIHFFFHLFTPPFHNQHLISTAHIPPHNPITAHTTLHTHPTPTIPVASRGFRVAAMHSAKGGHRRLEKQLSVSVIARGRN